MAQSYVYYIKICIQYAVDVTVRVTVEKCNMPIFFFSSLCKTRLCHPKRMERKEKKTAQTAIENMCVQFAGMHDSRSNACEFHTLANI